ncbi:MAG: hypothetical protein JJU11_17205, partial [Candidatus Sumerlaeia bacterium]|nr:hypothetical protein [Candidatus Sumerlaeia bacterium]
VSRVNIWVCFARGPVVGGATAAVLWMLGGLRWGAMGGLVLLAVAFALGFYGFHGRLLFPPRLTFHWLPIIAMAGALAAVAPLFASDRGKVGHLIFLVVLAIPSVVGAIGSLPRAMMSPVLVGGVILLPFLLIIPARMAGERLHPGAVLAWAFVAFSMTGLCLLLSGTARMGQLSGIIPSMILAMGWLAYVRPQLMNPAALLVFLLPLYVAFLVIGAHSVSLSPLLFVLNGAMAVSMGAGCLPMKWCAHPVVVGLVAAVFGGIAVLLAWMAHPGFV